MAESTVAGSREGAGPSPIVWILAALVALLGLWARFAGLGARPLAVDEYYFLVSIESILADGLPDLPGGGYYVRGVLAQYLTAGAIAVTGDAMLGLRLVPVVFGLGSVALGFVFGTQVGDRRVGVALAVMLLLSSWQVEFSRFGRMYAPLQFFTLLFLVGYTWTLAGRGGWRRYLPVVAALLAIGTHRLGLLLAPLLFVPMIVPGVVARLGGRKHLLLYGVSSLAVVAVGLWQLEAVSQLRLLGVEDPFPPDYRSGPAPVGQSGRWVVPGFPFWQFADSAFGNLVVVLGSTAVAAVVLAVALRKLPIDVRVAHVLGGAALVPAVFHQLALAGLLVLFLVFQYRSRLFLERYRGALLGLASTAVVAGVWLGYAAVLTYGVGDRAWMDRTGESVFRWAAQRTFFGWPDLYDPALAPWMAEAPLLTALLLPALVLAAWLGGGKPLAHLVSRPGFPVAYMALLFGVLSQQYNSTRYWFFLYPALLAALLLAGRELGERIGRASSWRGTGLRAGTVGIATAVGLFSLTDDLNPLHLVNVRSQDVAYRTNAFERYESLWYSREDVRSPAELVNERLATGGQHATVIVNDVPQVSYYLEAPHGVFYTRRNDRFPNVSRQRGTVDLWSGQRLLSTEDDLREYTRDRSEVWILRRAGRTPPDFDVDRVWGDRVVRQESLYIGPDGFVEVLRLEVQASR